MKQFLSTKDLTHPQLLELLELALRGKETNWREFDGALKGKVIALLFLKQSLRTLTSFQAGIARLGGTAVPIFPGTQSWGFEFADGAVMNGDKPEHIKEAAGVLSSYFDAVCVRAFPEMKSWEEDKNDVVFEALKKYVSVPLVSLESSLWHPCQALADALTLLETFPGGVRKKKFVLSWAPHLKQIPMAVPNSTLLIASQMGLDVTLACPKGFELGDSVIEAAESECKRNGTSFQISNAQDAALKGAHVVYAKSWTPPHLVGKPDEEREEREQYSSWKLTNQAMKSTKEAYFMHCLPVRRNVEVSDEVLDNPRSLIQRQAANRLHVQNALLLSMLRQG